MRIEIVILAAGMGTRMRSTLPKVLHTLAGRPLLWHVVRTAQALEPDAIHVVYGHGGEGVRAAMPGAGIDWVEQPNQLGTGHAVACAMPRVDPAAMVLVMYGDVPLIQPSTVASLVELAGPHSLALLTARMEPPNAYGRVLRDAAGEVIGIVEARDASPGELEVREVNTGFLAAPANRLAGWLDRLQPTNAQGEHYLTDVISLAVADETAIRTLTTANPAEFLGVNRRSELATLERLYQRELAQRLMDDGITLRDPERFDLRGDLVAGLDCEIDANVLVEGRVQLGSRVRIGPNNVLRDCVIGDNVLVRENCVIEGVTIGAGCIIGPFARLRPGTTLDAGVHVGNFVELKNANVGEESKINHLSYVGDSQIGRGVNIGAGTITCNYDGAHKHRTVIGDGAFVGSNTSLVAPVSVGEGATIGAGSTITHDAPGGELTLSRVKQHTVKGWQRPAKK